VLDIMKSQSGYSYTLQVDSKTYTGKVPYYGSDAITLEGIPWKQNSNGKAGKPENTDLMREGDGVVFQNHGDPMAPYTIFDCIGEKYVKLKKEAAAKAPATLAESGGNTFTDSRDGKAYKTVKIGSQTWMAENLNYEAKGSLCYDNKKENCDKYGRLYDWKTAMKVCPSGWHLPSDAEWENLVTIAGGDKVAGTKLKAKSGWKDNRNGTDDFGFSALPAGFHYVNNEFFRGGEEGEWWSATDAFIAESPGGTDESYAYYWDIFYDYESIEQGQELDNSRLSVRCVQGEAVAAKAPAAAKSGGSGVCQGKETLKTIEAVFLDNSEEDGLMFAGFRLADGKDIWLNGEAPDSIKKDAKVSVTYKVTQVDLGDGCREMEILQSVKARD
jgi:uncharacterized protein (TIGR02145 family)